MMTGRYPLLFSVMGDSVIVTNAEGHVMDINPAAERVLGTPAAAVIGKQARHAFPDLVPLLEGTGPEGNELRMELAVRIRDAVRDFDAISIPLRSKSGPSPGRLLLLHDITERKKSAEALRESDRRFHELVDLLPEIVFECDISGKFTYVNDNSLLFFGYTREDMERGLNLFDHIIPEDRQRVMQGIERIARGEKTPGSEYTAVKRDGTRFPFLVYTTRVMHNGRCTGIRGIFIDMTERKKNEQAMQQAMEKLNLLNSITRHDILNKLTALSTYLSLVGEEVTGPTAIGYVNRCTEIVETVNQHVEFMRDYQEIGIHSPVWQDPAVTIRGVSASCEYRDITIQAPDPGWEIFTDPLFEKVIYNLIDNAGRHGEYVKTITFTIRETDGRLLLVYEDDGAGISEEFRRNLFMKGVGKNTGLGLFLSREVLGITGISIREAGVPGRGARFEILVPAGSYRRISTS